MTEIVHGTVKGYRQGCREPCCGVPQATASREWRERTGRAKMAGPRQRGPHGTRTRYMVCTDGEDGGRCQPCKDANCEYQKMWAKGITLHDPMIEAALER